MKISDCLNDKNAASKAYEKMIEADRYLHALITPAEPSSCGEGRLTGVPVILKDNVSTRGIRTTASSKILQDYVPAFDATIVGKLRKEGAVIIGKSSMDELSMGGRSITSLTGPVSNPYDLSRTPGGSSGGSAAFVAANVVPVAIGSDTGDSVRKPASFCGIVGVKPTYGRISRYGIIPYASSLDHVGYFTTNVPDAAVMLEILAGKDEKDLTSSGRLPEEWHKNLNSDIRGKKILVFSDVLRSTEDERVHELFNGVLKKLRERGAVIEEVSFDEKLLRAVLPVYYVIANAEATTNHADLTGVLYGNRVDRPTYEEMVFATRSAGFTSDIKKRFVIGSWALSKDNQEKVFRKAQKIRRLIVNEVLGKLKDADVLIAPAAAGIAPRIDEENAMETDDLTLIADNHMIIGNFSGAPSMSLPMGFIEGMPAGIEVMANPFHEQAMFDIALAIEEITGLSDTVKEVVSL